MKIRAKTDGRRELTEIYNKLPPEAQRKLLETAKALQDTQTEATDDRQAGNEAETVRRDH